MAILSRIKGALPSAQVTNFYRSTLTTPSAPLTASKNWVLIHPFGYQAEAVMKNTIITDFNSSLDAIYMGFATYGQGAIIQKYVASTGELVWSQNYQRPEFFAMSTDYCQASLIADTYGAIWITQPGNSSNPSDGTRLYAVNKTTGGLQTSYSLPQSIYITNLVYDGSGDNIMMMGTTQADGNSSGDDLYMRVNPANGSISLYNWFRHPNGAGSGGVSNTRAIYTNGYSYFAGSVTPISGRTGAFAVRRYSFGNTGISQWVSSSSGSHVNGICLSIAQGGASSQLTYMVGRYSRSALSGARGYVGIYNWQSSAWSWVPKGLYVTALGTNQYHTELVDVTTNISNSSQALFVGTNALDSGQNTFRGLYGAFDSNGTLNFLYGLTSNNPFSRNEKVEITGVTHLNVAGSNRVFLRGHIRTDSNRTLTGFTISLEGTEPVDGSSFKVGDSTLTFTNILSLFSFEGDNNNDYFTGNWGYNAKSTSFTDRTSATSASSQTALNPRPQKLYL